MASAFVLTLGGIPWASGTAAACYACAAHLDLVHDLYTQDGVRVCQLDHGVDVRPWRGPGEPPPRLAAEGDQLMDGSPLPSLPRQELAA
jgi:hypothetical protein